MSPHVSQICFVEQLLQMGDRQEVWKEDWSVRDECRDMHVIPCVLDNHIFPKLPVNYLTIHLRLNVHAQY